MTGHLWRVPAPTEAGRRSCAGPPFQWWPGAFLCGPLLDCELGSVEHLCSIPDLDLWNATIPVEAWS